VFESPATVTVLAANGARAGPLCSEPSLALKCCGGRADDRVVLYPAGPDGAAPACAARLIGTSSGDPSLQLNLRSNCGQTTSEKAHFSVRPGEPVAGEPLEHVDRAGDRSAGRAQRSQQPDPQRTGRRRVEPKPSLPVFRDQCSANRFWRIIPTVDDLTLATAATPNFSRPDEPTTVDPVGHQPFHLGPTRRAPVDRLSTARRHEGSPCRQGRDHPAGHRRDHMRSSDMTIPASQPASLSSINVAQRSASRYDRTGPAFRDPAESLLGIDTRGGTGLDRAARRPGCLGGGRGCQPQARPRHDRAPWTPAPPSLARGSRR
jgi:hypothetical protein